MPWFNLSFSDFIKKRVCKFLINRYLGQFFDEKLTADQICLDLYNGKGSVFDVKLCCESINSIFEAQGWDFEVTAGSIGSVTVGIPWNCLMSEDSIVEVDRLCLCLRPCPRIKDDGTTMLESMWSSMSSSMQLAQECLERNSDEEAAAAANSSNMEGLEKFAQTIDNILNRIKAKFINTEVRLEYLPKDSDVGVVLIMKLKSFEYQNEASSDTSEKDDGEKGDQKTILFATHATHHIALEDITFYTEEFRIGDPKKSTRSRKTSTKSAEDTTFNSTISTDPYLSAISSFSPDNEMFYNESASIKNEDEENDSDESDDEFDNVYRSEMVMIGRLANRQEIRINMKLAEQIEGPKVSLNMSIGALTLFFTPRQMHMLLLLCDIILNEAPSSGSDNEVLKEMSPPRQSRVEEEKRRFGGLMGHQTWSGEDYDCNSEFTSAREMHVINKLRPVETDSVFSSNSSSMTSSIGSSASANTSRRRRAIERDQNADISHFSIRIAGLYVVILHDDVLMATTKIRNDESPLNESSVEKLKRKCEHFFNCVAESSGTYSTSDLIKIGNMLKAACDNNHLRLMFAPIIVDGEERRTTKGNCTKLNVSISRADIHEILGDLCLPLLEFQRKDSTAIIPEQPEVSINIEKTFYVMRSSSGKQFTAPRLNLGVTLGIAKFDFDITIFDRLNALFSSPFSSFMSDGSSYDQDTSDLPPSSQKIVQSKSKIKIQSDCFSLAVRFPIVDLRPLHDPEKRPWWQRHVRPEFLVIKFSDFQLNYISPSTYDVMANEINVLYHETEKAQAINIARASLYEHTANKYYSSSTDYPRIVVQFPTDAQILEMNETFIREQSDGRAEDTDSDPASGESIKFNPIKERESTPFSTKKVCRESDTPHGKTNEDESETLLIPGDRDEINSFCDNAMKFSKIQIKVDLPVISVQLKSKHLYEVIYNRIISDILMWESSVPKAKPPEVAMTLKKPPDSLMNAGMMDSIYAPFSMCKSKINFESGSSATNSESESENDAVYYSIHEKQRQKRLQSIYQKDYSNATSFQLHVGQGMVTMYAPVRDSSNHVIPGQLGEFVLKVSATTIFTVSSYHGNSNLGYFCIQSGNLEMFHCGQLPVPIQNPPLRDLFCLLPTWLKSSLYSTPKNLTLSESRGSTKRDMLSLAVQIKANPEQGIKRTKISAGVQMATLKHNASLPEHLWLTQLMDMFDVKEEIVPGYTPYTNLTEFHLHLWDCAIDYRPLHYPFRAVATIGTFMVSSNIATGSVGCTLRFVAEEATLCLAPQLLSEELPEDNKISALPSIELISVAELGLFEISLRLNDKVTPLSPKYDLRAAIKDVHIRTCSDSGKALLEFISYLASEGDLVGEEDVDDAQSEASSMQQMNEPEDELLQMKTSTAPEVTQTQQQHVNSLMADAMEESIYIPSSRNNSGDSDELVDLGTDVFFFPDEQSKREIRFGSSGAIRKIDSCKRRYASEDSISIDSSSYREDEDIFVRRFEQREEDSGSVNTEMRELLDFETSVMIGLKEPIEDFDPLPQVEMDLGDISKYDTPPKRNQPTRKLSSDSDEDFCIVADEERPNYGEAPVVQTDDPIRIIDNHFSAPHGKPDLLKAPADFPMAVQRYTLCEMTLVWHMFGGHDFPTEDDKKKEKEERDEMNRRAFSSHYPMSEVYKMGVSYTKGSPMLMLGGGGGNSSSSNQPKLTWKTRGGYGRKHDVLMEIHLNKVRFSHETYPQTTEQASRQVLLITELEIRDRLAISNINKFLYHPTVGFRTRQGNNHMVVIKALHLRPEPALKTQECCLRISLLPIRLNIDQDSLLFLINFFNELSGGSDLSESKPSANSNPQTALKPHQPPVMMVELPEAAQELQARKLVSENLTLLLNEEEKSTNKESTEAPSEPASDSASPIFFRHIIFSPDVPIRLDYQGKRVELSHGPLAGLLMGLGQLQCSEIRLKRISYRHGILGFDRLLNFLIQEWLQDIKKRQLPKILGGVGPMYSLVQLFQGIFDLFWLPIEQYQKDGRIVRGLQRGAQSFTARTALAALEITSRLIYLLQITAETAYDMVSPAGPSVRRRVNRKGKRKRIHPPQDIREGMSNAYHIVKDGIGDTANTIIQMAALEHDQKGYTGAVGAVMRQIPPTMVRPIVLAAQATTNVIGGLKNELIPNARIEAKEKWKDDDDN